MAFQPMLSDIFLDLPQHKLRIMMPDAGLSHLKSAQLVPERTVCNSGFRRIRKRNCLRIDAFLTIQLPVHSSCSCWPSARRVKTWTCREAEARIKIEAVKPSNPFQSIPIPRCLCFFRLRGKSCQRKRAARRPPPAARRPPRACGAAAQRPAP